MPTKIKYIVLAAIVFLFILIVIIVRNSLAFKLVNTNPSSNSVATVSPFFDINFNKDLSSKALVISSPQSISSYKVAGKSIDIALNIPLTPNKKYLIKVSDIYSKSGQYIKPQYFYFTPKNIEGNSLPADQTQALINKEKQYDQQVEGNSLLQLLPFNGPNFEYRVNYTINYSSNTDTVVIEITGPTLQSQQDALAWIKSQGYNTAKLDINYISEQP